MNVEMSLSVIIILLSIIIGMLKAKKEDGFVFSQLAGICGLLIGILSLLLASKV